MGIRNKLFLIFLGTFLVLIVAASGFYYLSFVRSLDTYLDERQQSQVERLADHLGTLYQQQGSWQFLRDDPRRLKRLYWLAGDREEDKDDRGNHRHLQLLDAHKRVLIGPPPRKIPHRCAHSDGRHTVGYLTYPDQEAIRDKLDRRFIGRQLRFALWMLSVAWLFCWCPGCWPATWSRRFWRFPPHPGATGRRLQFTPGRNRRDELGTTRQVDQLAERLDQGQQARQRWFSDIAHELRTPVAILQGELEALCDGIRPLNQENLKGLESEVAQLTHLINDLHDLALADGGNLRYQFRLEDLSSLIEDVLDSYRGAFAQREITCRTTLPDQALLQQDPVRLRQLLDNLFQNSLVHRRRRRAGRFLDPAKDDTWLLTVDDSAPGVPDDALPKLFDHLYRVESPVTAARGSRAGARFASALSKPILHAQHSPLGGVRIQISLPGDAPGAAS